MLNKQNGNQQFEDEVDDAYNSLFKSTMNIDILKSQNAYSSKTMKSSDFDLDKELAQSKINFNINEIIEPDKFLKKRIWDSSDDNKIEQIENKIEQIYKELDKGKINDLIEQINRCKLERFYKDFKPKVNDKTIGSVSSLDFLVETTFNCNESHYDIMITDRKELNPYIYKFRSVLGDGDCFYRGFIFSFLENIVLTNNIMLMKELLILYYEKINLKNELLKKKDYLMYFHQMNINITSQIIYILINQMENDINMAYNCLLKVFLYCPDFDFDIIYFTRYLIYEYISANENKIYSKKFQVEVGCLLPENFVVEKGNKNEYFFENYYSMQLMQPKSFAEKIVLYIVPFVFNVNMNILIYDFGINGAPSSIQPRDFLCEDKNNSQIEINLLFRKAHYDIYYKQKYYEDNKKFLNQLRNIKEDIKIINSKPKEKTKENTKSNKDEHALDKDLINDDGDIEDNKNDKNEDINKNNETICLQCKKPYSHQLNIFYLCNECLLNNLKSALLGVYIEFIQHKDNLINTTKKFKLLLQKTHCSISEVQTNTTLNEAIINSNFEFEQLFSDIRKKICVFCGEDLKSENDYFIKFPCSCRICSQKCFLSYTNRMQQVIILEDRPDGEESTKHLNFLNCYCGYIYHTLDVLEMIQITDKRNLKEQKEMYQNYISNLWNWKCMICHKSFNQEDVFYRLIFETDNIDKKLLKPKSDLKHLLCGVCHENIVKNQKVIFCKICEFEHKVNKTKKVDENNEDENCVIF